MAITVIGLLSNFLSGLIHDACAIAVDVLWLWKMYACYIAFKNICKKPEVRSRLIVVRSKPAKLAIWIAFITALIGQVADIGVAGLNNTVVLGLKQYGFFWKNGIWTGLLLFCCLMVLSANPSVNDKKLYGYLVLSAVPMILTFSSLVLCWLVIVLALKLILFRRSTIKLGYMIVLGVALLVVLAGEVQTYLMSESVRATWLEYGAITANTYFPFGSGFATFGSEMASRYYSPLYIQYGWEYTWALGREGRFLNDNFLAGLMGQLGWPGIILYLFILVLLIRTVNSAKLEKRPRIMVLSTLITLYISMIGTASSKSLMGVCAFSVMGMIMGGIDSQKARPAQSAQLNRGATL